MEKMTTWVLVMISTLGLLAVNSFASSDADTNKWDVYEPMFGWRIIAPTPDGALPPEGDTTYGVIALRIRQAFILAYNKDVVGLAKLMHGGGQKSAEQFITKWRPRLALWAVDINHVGVNKGGNQAFVVFRGSGSINRSSSDHSELAIETEVIFLRLADGQWAVTPERLDASIIDRFRPPWETEYTQEEQEEWERLRREDEEAMKAIAEDPMGFAEKVRAQKKEK